MKHKNRLATQGVSGNRSLVYLQGCLSRQDEYMEMPSRIGDITWNERFAFFLGYLAFMMNIAVGVAALGRLSFPIRWLPVQGRSSHSATASSHTRRSPVFRVDRRDLHAPAAGD
jgi:hypothetical protein